MKTIKNTILVLILALFSTLGINAQTVKKVLFVLTSHEDLGNTGNKTGFFGYKDSSGYWTYIPDATNTNSVIKTRKTTNGS